MANKRICLWCLQSVEDDDSDGKGYVEMLQNDVSICKLHFICVRNMVLTVSILKWTVILGFPSLISFVILMKFI